MFFLPHSFPFLMPHFWCQGHHDQHQHVEWHSSSCEAVNCDASHLTTLTTSCRIPKCIHFRKPNPGPQLVLPICIKSTRCRLPGHRGKLVLRHVRCHLQIVNSRRLDNRQCSPVNRKCSAHNWFTNRLYPMDSMATTSSVPGQNTGMCFANKRHTCYQVAGHEENGAETFWLVFLDHFKFF